MNRTLRFLPHILTSVGLAFTLAACSSAKKTETLPDDGSTATIPECWRKL